MFHKKRPWAAGVLNFIFPGLGLLYQGYKKAALVNFAIVNGVLILCMAFGDSKLLEHVHYVFLGLAALSAGYAHGVASTAARGKELVTQEANESIPV